MVGRLSESVADLDDGQNSSDDVGSEGTRATTRAWLQRAFPAASRAGGGQKGSTGDRCALVPHASEAAATRPSEQAPVAEPPLTLLYLSRC